MIDDINRDDARNKGRTSNDCFVHRMTIDGIESVVIFQCGRLLHRSFLFHDLLGSVLPWGQCNVWGSVTILEDVWSSCEVGY